MNQENNKEIASKENFPKKIRSSSFKTASMIIGAFLIFLIGFAIGTRVGFHKARFSSDFGKNYERNFIGPIPPGPMGKMFDDFEGKGMRNPHGMAGEIISVSDSNIIIKDMVDEENTINVTEKTIIKNGRDNIKISDLKLGDKIVVLGKPKDNGTVDAHLVRIFNPDDIPGNNLPD